MRLSSSSVALLFAAGIVIATCTSLAHAYQEMPVSDGGTIEGKVLYQGAVPLKKIIPTKDKETCGDIREEPQVVVGSDKGVQDVVVYLKGVEKGKAWEKPATPYTVNNHKCKFEPQVQVVPMGVEVAIVNSDPVLHNTHGYLDKRTVFNVALPDQGMQVKKDLKRPGLVRVECDAHGWMLSWIYVADNPYYAVTAKDGAFTIADVPPGNYTLVAWQEYTGAMETPVTVKAKEVVRVPIELKKQ
jgi:hypothetical protein